MSILTDKTILIVGNKNKQVLELESVLRKHKMNVITADCGELSLADIQSKNVSIVVLNHLHDADTCTEILDELRGKILSKSIPIFAMVENSEDRIKHALMLGAADYITPNESAESVTKKIKSIFGQPDNFSSTSVLDVPPDTAFTTKKGIRVYIIEDDPLLRNLLGTRLEASSFPSGFSTDGEDIIFKILDFKPQVIILDLMLPIKDGFEILEELKKNSALKPIPVIVFSNRDSQEDKQRVFTLGADRFFVKAMTDLSVLIETIEELVG
ncbi:MAG: response regulator [Candidatus Pacebacteria bacterium]|nr:response regulator [Candidatus Paceibacterota bacterium]